MAEEDVDWNCLVNRLTELEYLVFKPRDGKSGERRHFKSVADGTYIVQDRLHRARSGKKNIKHVWQQLEFLHKIVSPEYLANLNATDDVKKEVILASEGYITSLVEHLEKIKSLQEYISDDIWKNVPDQLEKFHALQRLFTQQQITVENLSKEVQELLINYNQTIDMLSRQFIEWDQAITRLEIKLGIADSEETVQ